MSTEMIPQKTETIELSKQEAHELIAMRVRIKDVIWHLQQALEMLDEKNIKQQAQDVSAIIEEKIKAARRVA